MDGERDRVFCEIRKWKTFVQDEPVVISSHFPSWISRDQEASIGLLSRPPQGKGKLNEESNNRNEIDRNESSNADTLPHAYSMILATTS